MNMSAESDEQAVESPQTPAEPAQDEPNTEAASPEIASDPASETAAAEASPSSEKEAEPMSAPEPVDTAVNPADEAESKVADGTDSEATENVEPQKPKKQRRQSSRTPRKNQPTLRQVTARFAGCGRCSYFWAGYRVLHGIAELETAVAQSKSGWLELVWNLQMRELIHKSYGVRLDVAHFHYEGCCKECRRHFIYEEADAEDEADAFRIEISPRMSK